MRKYRSQPPRSQIRADDDDWYGRNEMDRSITVYEAESHWQQIPILHPETGRPIEVYTGPDPIGFIWFEEE